MITTRCIASTLVLVATTVGAARAQISAPIVPGATVEIVDVVSFPDTRGQGVETFRSEENIARINFTREIPGFADEWMVNDLRGPVYRVHPATQQVTEYLDVGDVFSRFSIGPAGLSTGLNTVALHPEFASNGKFYSIHSESATGNPATPDFGVLNPTVGHTVVVEWTADDPSANTFTGTHRELLRIGQGVHAHNLGDISFNPLAGPGDPDFGLMYIAGGDSGSAAQAQNLDSIFGKLLRIDPEGSNSANGAYGVPADNPYASDGLSSTLGEIYAHGFRNLHRIGWDRLSGALLGTDIGANSVEEVNFLEPDGDYGWNAYEGTFLQGGGQVPAGTDTSAFDWPAAQYDHGDGFAIAGGFVYRGSLVPELNGMFLFGDIVNGRLFYSDYEEMVAAHNDGDYLTTATVYELFLTRDGLPVTLKDVVTDARPDNALPFNRTDLRFGQDSNGEIYLSTKQDGWIRSLLGDRLAGDYNNDGVVGVADYTAWRDAAAAGAPAADGNGDGVVDAEDHAVWGGAYGFTQNGSSLGADIAVPEPSAVALVGLLAITSGRVLRSNRS